MFETEPAAENRFNLRAVLVMISLLKLTGAISQYWVLYKAAAAEGANDSSKMEEFNMKKSKRNLPSSSGTRVSESLEAQIL